MFTIKNFGNDTEVRSLEKLAEVLHKNHTGRSVTISFKLPTGIVRNEFIDVREDGRMYFSYGNQSEFTTDVIRFALGMEVNSGKENAV